MAVLRTRCISTKVTTDEYATLEAVAIGQTLSGWVREVLLATATPHPADLVLLAEVLALRTIVLNLHFAAATGETPTTDAVKRLIERVDQDKIRKAPLAGVRAEGAMIQTGRRRRLTGLESKSTSFSGDRKTFSTRSIRRQTNHAKPIVATQTNT